MVSLKPQQLLSPRKEFVSQIGQIDVGHQSPSGCCGEMIKSLLTDFMIVRAVDQQVY
jgi:hypothetical protein